MKRFFISLLLQKYKPKLVVVYGLYGRQEARTTIATVLHLHTSTFSAPAQSFFQNLFRHVGGLWRCIIALVLNRSFPQICIIDGDIKEEQYQMVTKALTIDVAVLLPVGDIPSFTDVFFGFETEARKVVSEARRAQAIFVNADDEALRSAAEEIRARKKFFGFEAGADLRILDYACSIPERGVSGAGMHIKIEYEGSVVPFFLPNAFGKRHIYAACSALAVALHYGLNLITASQDLERCAPLTGSLHAQVGMKEGMLLSHSVELTPYSAREVFEVIRSLKEAQNARRVVAVVSDVLLHHTGEVEGLHRTLGELAAYTVDILILFGERVVFIEEEAQRHGMRGKNIFRYVQAKEAIEKAKKFIEEGDLVLILGSPETGIEQVAEELTV